MLELRNGAEVAEDNLEVRVDNMRNELALQKIRAVVSF